MGSWGLGGSLNSELILSVFRRLPQAQGLGQLPGGARYPTPGCFPAVEPLPWLGWLMSGPAPLSAKR